jgi:hypothetical protein
MALPWADLFCRVAAVATAVTRPSMRAPIMTTSVTSDEALRVARLDAEKAYRDLSPFCVRVELEDDGWHVDYELKNKLSHGGAPHYVIDAQTGAIRMKRYEQ